MALPDGLKFLQLGWWVSHLLAVWLLYAWAYRKGRNDERKEQRRRARETPPPSPTTPH